MPIPVEEIPNEDQVGRAIYWPSMYDGSEDLIAGLVFQFPKEKGERCECIIWSKYAPVPDGIHAIGVEDEATKRERGSKATYKGFILTIAGRIRQIASVNGHGFALAHDPPEGDYHIKVTFRAAANLNITKPERSELKLFLLKAFDPLVPCVRANA